MHVKHNCINQSCQYTITNYSMSIIVSVMDSIRIAERHKMSVYNLCKESDEDGNGAAVPLIAYAN
jgi:hypothetical protein